MVGAVTVKGGALVEMNFVGYLPQPQSAGKSNYANFFGSGASLGASSVIYDGSSLPGFIRFAQRIPLDFLQ